MKESIKISTQSVIIGTIQMVIISFLLIGCNTQKSDFKIIQTERVGKDYQYNPNGFIENNYGYKNYTWNKWNYIGLCYI